MKHTLFAAFLLLLLSNSKIKAQDSITVADYQSAESRLKYVTNPLISNAFIDEPIWKSDSRELTYKMYSSKGIETEVAINLNKKKKTEKIVSEIKTEKKEESKHKTPPKVASPDGKKLAFVDNYNLWVEDAVSKTKKQLTFDGIKDFGYATDNMGWQISDAAILRWSPDSKQIATFQLDERNLPEMYLVSTNVGHPVLKTTKYTLPGDSIVAKHQIVIINTETAKTVRLKVAPDFHRGTIGDAFEKTFSDIDWNPNGSELAFVSVSRDYKNAKVRIANSTTGNVREIFEETAKTQYDGSPEDAINWRYLPTSKEIIWYSERDNWGHLYLYDSETGKLKNQITKGDWLVSEIKKVDEKHRKIYFLAVGLQKENPYFQSFCSIDFSGKNFKILTPEIGTHKVTLSPDASYFVDTYSQPDVAPISLIRKIDGSKWMDLEKADISRLVATGWKAPIVLKVKADDGVTDVHGVLFTPGKLLVDKKYPIIDYIYPGPQTGSVSNWDFDPSRRDNAALAELGTYVLALEGTSTPYRSKSYHDISYGNMAINTLPDQVAAIKQLAAIYPIDINKVGIWGHSGGGFATAAAMFKYPDFFKVGISESGNHDNRNYTDAWGEKYNGLTKNSDYASQANPLYAKNLKGKLLLAHGLMDNNVPPQHFSCN